MIAWQCTPSSGIWMVGPVDRAVRQLVVERAREDARGRGLADAAHAGQDAGLRDAAGLERVRDRAHHRLLADQVVEGGRAVFARQHAIGRRPPARPPRSKPPRAPLSGGFGIAARHRSIRIDVSSAACGTARRISAWRAPALRDSLERTRWEADERPDRSSLGLLPSGPDPVGE